MKTDKKRNFPLLIIIGLVALAATQISSHYFEINDSVMGFLMGFSISLMILGLVQLVKKKRTSVK